MIIIKLVTYQEAINIINMYVSSNKALKYISQKMDRTQKIVDKFVNFWSLMFLPQQLIEQLDINSANV